MTPYTIAIALHVLSAVMGLGAIPGATAAAGLDFGTTASKIALLRRMTLTATISLSVMLLTGIAILVATRGAGGESLWLRVSFMLFLLTGAMLGVMRRSLRNAEKDPQKGFASVRRFGGIASLCVAIIVVLMQAKPF